MSLEQHIRTLLIEDAILSDSVGFAGGSRIYYLRVPQASEFPAISMQRISTISDYHLKGRSKWQDVRLQVDCWGKTLESLRSKETGIVPAVLRILDNYRGSRHGNLIGSIIKENERDLFENEVNLYRVSIDFIITCD